MSTAPVYDYKVFGLHVQSDLELPELATRAGGPGPDVRITLGKIVLAGALKEIPSANELTLSIDGVARYSVVEGRDIIVEPATNAQPRNIRLYLLGSAMGMILHQRGILPLHATAIEIGGEAFAFMGESGAGKSTLAAWFHDRGHRIIADDVCAVRFDQQGRAMVSPGLSRLRLWKEALEATGRDCANYERSYAGADDWDKFDVPTHHETSAGAAVPLTAIYVLSAANEFVIAPLRGINANAAIHAHTYRGQYLTQPQDVRSHWEMCLKLLAQSIMFTLERRRGFPEFNEQAARIRAHAESLVGRALSKVDGG